VESIRHVRFLRVSYWSSSFVFVNSCHLHAIFRHKYSWSLVFQQLIDRTAFHKDTLDSEALVVADTVMQHLISSQAVPALSISAPTVGSVIEDQTPSPYCRNDEA
jgi:hypothetical protein